MKRIVEYIAKAIFYIIAAVIILWASINVLFTTGDDPRDKTEASPREL